MPGARLRPVHGVLLAFTLTVCSLGLAHAAGFSGFSSQTGSGATHVFTACDSAVTVTYTTTAGKLVNAVVSGLADPACEGEKAQIVIKDSAGVRLAESAPVTIAADGDTLDNSVTLPLSPATINPDSLANYSLVITG